MALRRPRPGKPPIPIESAERIGDAVEDRATRSRSARNGGFAVGRLDRLSPQPVPPRRLPVVAGDVGANLHLVVLGAGAVDDFDVEQTVSEPDRLAVVELGGPGVVGVEVVDAINIGADPLNRRRRLLARMDQEVGQGRAGLMLNPTQPVHGRRNADDGRNRSERVSWRAIDVVGATSFSVTKSRLWQSSLIATLTLAMFPTYEPEGQTVA